MPWVDQRGAGEQVSYAVSSSRAGSGQSEEKAPVCFSLLRWSNHIMDACVVFSTSTRVDSLHLFYDADHDLQ